MNIATEQIKLLLLIHVIAISNLGVHVWGNLFTLLHFCYNSVMDVTWLYVELFAGHDRGLYFAGNVQCLACLVQCVLVLVCWCMVTMICGHSSVT